MKKLLLVLPIFVIALMLGSCLQEGFPSVAHITVLDENETPVEGVTVKLTCEGNDCVEESEQVSDEFGYTRHEFPEPVVMKIHATLEVTTEFLDDSGVVVTSVSTLEADDWVIIPQHDEVSQDIVIRP